MPHSVASDMGLHCLPMSYKNDARLIWVKLLSLYWNLPSDMMQLRGKSIFIYNIHKIRVYQSACFDAKLIEI